uniref:Uncharacterized protein n=1 Tax=Panagrolaimus sp. JU765 TaxID=591449 RepID=A0AC34QEF8_9BILA
MLVRATATAVTALASTDCIAHNYGAVTYTAFVQQASVTIKNLVISEYQMNLVAAQVMPILNLNNKAQFTQQIVVN